MQYIVMYTAGNLPRTYEYVECTHISFSLFISMGERNLHVKHTTQHISHWRATTHSELSRLHGLFACMDFPARRTSALWANRYFVSFACISRVRGTCESVASVLRGLRVTSGYGA